jgi:hypothetical protein
MQQVMNITTFICLLACLLVQGLQAKEIDPIRGQIKAENSEYVLKKQKYVQKHLQENNRYSLAKATAYLERSHQERDYLLQQLYETKLIEEIELRLEDFTNAKDEALEELEDKKSSYAKLYDKYLIPSLEKLVETLKTNTDCQGNGSQNCETTCDAIVDHYLMGYRAIFSPDKYRSAVFRDLPILENISILNGIEIAKNDPKKIEANNLKVNEKSAADIRWCLSGDIKVGSFLSETQTKKLMDCGFDFSRLEPGKSSLWNHNPPTRQELAQAKSMSIFPTENEKLKYTKVKFSGKGSPKFSVKFKRNGKKYKVKVKLGKEVHVDPIVSTIGKMLGLYQDETRYRQQIQVYYKSKDQYQRFLSQLTRKYGKYFTKNNFLREEHLGDGQVLVTFENVLLEATPKDVIKLNPFEQTGWDNLNRREYRAMLLWFAWLGIRDVKDDNWRLQLKKTKGKGLEVQALFQDVGAVLDGTGTIERSLVDFAIDGYRQISVNGFPDKITANNEKEVVIKWADLAWAPDFFSTVTYFDLKWMAKKIAKLSREDIEFAFDQGGLPEVEKTLYVEKVIKRRNDIVKTFNLDKQFAQIPTMDLNKYNVPGVVEKGVVTAPRIKGSIHNQLQINPIFFISQFINTSVNFGNLQKNLDVFFGNRYGVGANINFTDNKEINFDNKKTQVLTYPGIRLELTREIQLRPGGVHYQDEVHNYYSIDHLVIEFNLNAGFFQEFTKNLQLSAGAKVSVLKFEFDHWQPTATLKQAIRNPIRFQRILPNLKRYLIHELQAGETFSYSTGNGVELNANLPIYKYGRFGMNIGYANSSPVFYHRNHFGELEIFKDEQHEKSFGFFLEAGINLGFFFFPLAGFEYQRTVLNGKSSLYRFDREIKEKGAAKDPLFNVKTLIERKALQVLLDGDIDDILPLMHREYQVNYVMDNELQKSFFLLFNRERLNQYSGVNIVDHKGKELNFHRFMRMDSYKIGKALPLIGGWTLFYGDQNNVDVQIDEKEPEKFVAAINYYDYERKLSRKELINFIEKQNKYFSKDKGRNGKFYSSEFIPDADEVKQYRKVLAHQRVFLYGDDFIKNVESMSRRQMENRITKLLGLRLNKFDEDAYERGRVSEIVRLIYTSKDLLKSGQYRTFSDRLSKLVLVLDDRKYGLDPLMRLFGKNNIYVMGEIYGVLNSFSNMAEENPNAGRRFTGKSWGDYKRVPPVWRYLDKHPLLYSTPAPVLRYLDLEAAYGILPTGEPFVL